MERDQQRKRTGNQTLIPKFFPLLKYSGRAMGGTEGPPPPFFLS